MEKDDTDLMNTFKVAANSLALLYKESQQHSRKSFVSGYQQALQDLWEFLSLQTGNTTIPISDIVSFIQSKHVEIPTVQEQGPAQPPTQPQIPEVVSEFGDSLKRRWGFGDPRLMSVDDEPMTKRARSKDRMSD